MFKLIVSLLVACQLVSAGLFGVVDDVKWTNAINAKLCTAGSHSDASGIPQAFNACYEETATPGGHVFRACSTRVFGVLMDSEANIDTVCALNNSDKTKFPLYAGCIMAGLAADMKIPTRSIHALNVCQGGVMGVAPPS